MKKKYTKPKTPKDKKGSYATKVQQYGNGEPEFWNSPGWIKYVRVYISYLRLRAGHVKQITHHDWEDIAQKALMNIWKFRGTYDDTRPLKPWIKTCVHSAYKQFLHSNVFYNGFKNPKDSIFKCQLKRPESIITRIEEANEFGVEGVCYEPDVQENEVSESFDEFKSVLADDEKVLLDIMDLNSKKGKSGSLTALKRELGITTVKCKIVRLTLLNKYDQFVDGKMDASITISQ